MQIDDSAWPLIVISLAKEVHADELPALFRAFEEDYFKRRTKYAILVDTRAVAQIPDPMWRATLARWLNSSTIRASMGRYNVGAVTIFSSNVMRGVYTALSWIWKSPSPESAATSMSEALAWSRKQLDASKVPITPAFRAFCWKHGVSLAP